MRICPVAPRAQYLSVAKWESAVDLGRMTMSPGRQTRFEMLLEIECSISPFIDRVPIHPPNCGRAMHGIESVVATFAASGTRGF
jgi:hypothetical protein